MRSVPDVRKAVKLNSPLYGIRARLVPRIHAFTRYLKLAFFAARPCDRLPPGASKDPHTRYVDIHEGDELDEAQMSKWLKQAAALPAGSWTTFLRVRANRYRAVAGATRSSEYT